MPNRPMGMEVRDDLKKYVVHDTTTLIEAAGQMKRNRSRTVVVTIDDKAIGMLSEGDLCSALLRGIDIHAQIKGIKQISFHYLEKRDMQEALMLFKKHLFGLLPIVDKNMRLLDVISAEDIFATYER